MFTEGYIAGHSGNVGHSRFELPGKGNRKLHGNPADIGVYRGYRT